MSSQKGSIYFSLAGPPGSGKGTLIDHVIRPYCEHYRRPLVVFPISAEIKDLLDKHPNEDSARAVRAQQTSGYLVPDNIANEALINALNKYLRDPLENAVFVVDGSPRTEEQTETTLITVPKRLGISSARNIFVRFTTRPYLCGYRACKRSRDDDNEESFKVRWGEFETKTIPALKLITSNKDALGVEIKEIDGAAIRQSPQLFQRLIFGHEI